MRLSLVLKDALRVGLLGERQGTRGQAPGQGGERKRMESPVLGQGRDGVGR